MEVGVVGKTNVGKSTFFKAATMVDVAISNRPFTTIEPNLGVAYVRSQCPHVGLNVKCNPRNSKCVGGTRLIPVSLIDVAGLIPGAHEGRGLGNKFLDDLRQASALIHVVDASGTTDFEGKPTSGHDPCDDVKFLEDEIGMWMCSILRKNWKNISRRLLQEKEEAVLAETLSGLSVSLAQIDAAVKEVGSVGENNLPGFSKVLRKIAKPIIVAANKMDLPESGKNLEKMRQMFPDMLFVPVCAEAELALRQAAEHGLIDYTGGDSDFVLKGDATPEQKKGLEFIREKILKKFGSTGVQETVDAAVFKLLKRIVVYPVEDETHYADGKGTVLPDAFMLPPSATARDLAAAVHTEMAKKFVCAVDAKSKRRISGEQVLKHNDVIRIMFNR